MGDRMGAPRGIEPQAGAKGATGSASDAASGRVGFDSRGNAVWEFRDGNKNFSREPSTTMVQKIQPPDLSLEQTGVVKRPDGTSQSGSSGPSGPVEGFNPYDRRGSSFGQTPVSAAPPRRPSRIVVTKRSKPGLLERLFEKFSKKSD